MDKTKYDIDPKLRMEFHPQQFAGNLRIYLIFRV